MGSSDSELTLIRSEAAAVRSMGGIVHVVGIGGLWNSQELDALFGTEYLLFKNRTKAMESIKSLNKICPPTNCKQAANNLKHEKCFGAFKHVFKIKVAGALNDAGVGVCREGITRFVEPCFRTESCNEMERRLGSCQTDKKLEVVETLQFFDRRAQSCVTHEEKQKVDCSQAKECKSQVADLIIVLDRSGSLWGEYGTLVDAAVELVKSMQLGDKNVHLGVVSFDDVSSPGWNQKFQTLKTAVEFGEEFDKAVVIDNMKNIKGRESLIPPGDALGTVRATLQSKGRKDVFKAIIVITGGKSRNQKLLFDSVSGLKRNGVTIFAIGVKQKKESLNVEELKMLTSPESNKNLFILDNFQQLKPWAEKFSARLCMELKPLNPKLCDADVQLKSISPCLQSTMRTTWVQFKYNAAKQCIKHFKNTVMNQCKAVCVDPIDGSHYLEGESWTNLCHEFRCDAGAKLIPLTKTKKCVAADFSCKASGSAPFQCRNTDGEVRDNCQCVDLGGQAALVVDSPN